MHVINSSIYTFPSISGIFKCSEDFYLDSISGYCRPECGEWDQYSELTRGAVYGTNISLVTFTIVVCVITLALSVHKRKTM